MAIGTTAAIIGGTLGGAYLRSRSQRKAAEQQAEGIANASDVSAAMADRARRDVLQLFDPAFSSVFDAAQQARNELQQGRANTYDILNRTNRATQDILQQGATNYQNILLGAPAQQATSMNPFTNQPVRQGGNIPQPVQPRQSLDVMPRESALRANTTTPMQQLERTGVPIDGVSTKQPFTRDVMPRQSLDVMPRQSLDVMPRQSAESMLRTTTAPGMPITDRFDYFSPDGGTRIPGGTQSDLRANFAQDAIDHSTQPYFNAGPAQSSGPATGLDAEAARRLDALQFDPIAIEQLGLPAQQAIPGVGLNPAISDLQQGAFGAINALQGGTQDQLDLLASGLAGGEEALLTGAATGRGDITSGLDSTLASLRAAEAQARGDLYGGLTSGLNDLTSGAATARSDLTSGLTGGLADLQAGASQARGDIAGALAATRSALSSGAGGAQGRIDSSLRDALASIDAGALQARGDIGDAFGAAQGSIGAGAEQARSDLQSALTGAESAVTAGTGRAEQALTGQTDAGLSALRDSLAGARGDIEMTYNAATGQYEPYQAAGADALQREAALSGALGADAQAAAFQEFQESPGQQWLREQSERALTRNAAATGDIGGGNIARELQAQAQGLALQDLDRQTSNLRSLATRGQQAAGDVAALQARQGDQLSNLGLTGGLQELSSRERLGQLLAGTAQNEGQLLSALRAQSGRDLASSGQSASQQLAALQSQEGQNLAGIAERLGQNTGKIQ